MLQWKRRGGHLELYVPSLPPSSFHKRDITPVPTHKEFLGHCWLHHDNCMINKAFLLGILPFTEEGQQSKEGETSERGGWTGPKS